MTEAVAISHRWNRSYFPCGGTEKAYLLVELKGNAVIHTNRAPINVGLVLDRSGSMSGQPLAHSLKACQYVTDQMGEGDLLSMVAFDDEVETIFPPEKVIYKDGMKSKIAAIEPGGSTNLSGGLLLGAQFVTDAKQDGMVNRVLLLSDGHANEGITDRGKLSRIAKEYQSMGIGISTLGVGHRFDEELMEAIADGGGGNFYYIEKPDDIPGIFAKELQGVLSVCGQNMRLKLRAPETAEVLRVYGYKPVNQQDGWSFSLGDIYDQEVKSLLIEMSFYPHTEGVHPVLQLELEYMDVTESAKPCKVQMDIAGEFTNNLGLLSMPEDTIVEKQLKITETAITIEKAMEAFDQGFNDEGITMLQAQADELLRMAVITDDADLRTESLLLYEQLEAFGEAPITAESRKALHSQKYRTMKRRN